MFTWRPCLREGELPWPLPSQGQGLEWEPQARWVRARALGRMEARAALSLVLGCGSPFICLLSHHSFLELFKGSGTFSTCTVGEWVAGGDGGCCQ